METKTLSVHNPRTVTFKHVLKCAEHVINTWFVDNAYDLPNGTMDIDDLADRIAELVMVGTIN